MGSPWNPANDPRPCFCGCERVCQRAQVKRWQWRRRRYGDDVPGPFFSKSCAMKDYHKRHPETATRVGLEHRKRLRQIHQERFAAGLDHLSGYERDLAIWRRGYSAGRQAEKRCHARNRRERLLRRLIGLEEAS